MQSLTLNEIRGRFLSFFEERGHLRMPSFPLIPKNDNSLLIINSGMAPLKPYFTGQEIPPGKRAVTCQKCVRTVDIDEVGSDARHGSFFEMLGNFSFGDYFKKECIPWAWEFLTAEMGIPADRLYVSVYEQDDEAYNIWRGDVGVPPGRIYKFGKEDNFWEHGAGPCGPDSEIFYDRGAAYGCGRPECTVGCDCDRFMEVWNLVFTQFNKRDDGVYDELASKNIDTGMGLERLACVLQGVDSIFEIDASKTIREAVLNAVNPPEGYSDASINIITDHARSVTFMAADGILPGNEGRGYVLRRLLRRAVRHGRLSGAKNALMADVCRAVISAYGGAYPELEEKSEYIIRVLTVEERRFLDTLDAGFAILTEKADALDNARQTSMSGADAFKLYDTYGFPLELTREMLAERGITVDGEGFAAEMEAQRQRARAARGVSNFMGAEQTEYHKLSPGLPHEFVGYTQTECEAAVLALTAGGNVVESAGEGCAVSVFLDKTPFYAESGGQKGDSGVIKTAGAVVEISDCVKVAGGNTAHRGVVTSGVLYAGDAALVSIDAEKRLNTARNHSAAHMLQKALRETLGPHVEQAGSEVSAERVRFDFTHMAPLTPEERQAVENRVNEQIMAGLPIKTTETGVDEARKMGAIALFGEKYGETVRVVDIGGWSAELCGGTHLANTQAAGLFKLLSESGVAAGVRRIEGITGPRALAYFRKTEALLQEAAAAAKTQPDKLAARVSALQSEIRQLKQELNKAKAQGGADKLPETLIDAAETYNGFKIIAYKIEETDAGALRSLADRLRGRLNSGVIVLCGVSGGAAQFLAQATDDAVKSGANAGLIVKAAAEVTGGGGGGRPNSAQAGGKDAAKADEALALAVEIIKKQLKG